MVDMQILPILTELGLKPTELFVLALLWQNIKNMRGILDKLVDKVNELERKTIINDKETY